MSDKLGRRDLLPVLLEEKVNSARPYGLVCHPTLGNQQVSFAKLNNAVNRASWFLKENLPSGAGRFTWMGKMDLRYFVFVLAAAKAGKMAIIASPRSPIPATLRFLAETGVKHILYGPDAALEVLLDAAQAAGWATLPYLDFAGAMDDTPALAFPYQETYEAAKDRHFFALHTSGTSGHPKPIYFSHQAIKFPAYYDMRDLAKQQGEGRDEAVWDMCSPDQVQLNLLPPIHAGGVITAAMAPFYMGNVYAMLHPDVPPLPENISRALSPNPDGLTVTSIFGPPSIVEAMVDYPSALDQLGKLTCVAFAGGPMKQAALDKLQTNGAHLHNNWGMTESGALSRIMCTGSPADANYFRFLNLGEQFEEFLPGLYELVFPRTDLIRQNYAFFDVCPDLDEFRTKDLFAPVPGRENMWVYKGRLDNLITLSNGYKLDPNEMEDKISSHPDVSGAVIAGNGRSAACLIVEMKEGKDLLSEEDKARTLAALWPVVDEANSVAPTYGKIAKELVHFAPQDKPFPRASKGTIQRRLTVMQHEAELDTMYKAYEENCTAKY
ncbi:hypothetical protein K438DRAFT_1835504 [Mycena galopus ATCC 62051]|nr:hypothetical protein K438DRAFT_1835504 [Mycena galopus ATCC 62051]